MATLVDRINDLASAIRNKFNQIMPRLPVAGGTSGQVLSKASDADYSFEWSSVYGPTNLVFGGGIAKSGVTVRTTGALAFVISGKPIPSQVLANFYLPYPVTVDGINSGGTAQVASNAPYTITLINEGNEMVKWTWGTGSRVPTVTVISGSLPAGQYSLEGQAIPDTVLENPSPTLAFVR